MLPFIFEAQTMAIQLVGNKLVGLYETADPFELKTLPVGIHTYLLTTGGNSLLSSLFVASCPSGASITVRYYSQTTGDGADERTPLTNHNPITAPQTAADQIIVTRIHNKTYVEVEILGAPVEFGLEVTVISTFAVDLSSATKKDNAPFVPLTDQALPIAVLDRTTNQYKIWGGDNGIPQVSVVGQSSEGVHLFGQDPSLPPGTSTQIFAATVPAGKTWRVKSALVSCSTQCKFEVRLDGVLVAVLRTGAGLPTSFGVCNFKALSGTIVSVDAETKSLSSCVDVTLTAEEI